MTTFIRFLVVLCAIFILSGCSTVSHGQSRECTVTSLENIVQNPLRYKGGLYCGHGFLRRFDRTIIITRMYNEEPSLDLAIVVTDIPSDITEINDIPKRFYIEAHIDVMEECFVQPEQNASSGEHCSPFRRPIFLNIRAAREN